ncbi:MAG: nitroreductase family protein, partial [Aggregatilineales bacterium]
MSISDIIRNKRAVRQYADKPVPQETIQQILDAARWSQSSK